MLRCWLELQVHRADLAVRRPTGAWLWHRDMPLQQLPLAWARAENTRGADIYIRPARGHDWPIVFLDDVAIELARKVTRRYAALLVHTSAQGGCHLWLHCAVALNEAARRDAQRLIAGRIGADPASTSGEHLGRLAGMKNRKRHGQWVNVIDSSIGRAPWDPSSLDSNQPAAHHNSPTGHLSAAAAEPTASVDGVDHSPSGKEWGWVCGALEAGVPIQTIYDALLRQARARRGPDADRYAIRTLGRAIQLKAIDPTIPRTRGLPPLLLQNLL